MQGESFLFISKNLPGRQYRLSTVMDEPLRSDGLVRTSDRVLRPEMSRLFVEMGASFVFVQSISHYLFIRYF